MLFNTNEFLFNNFFIIFIVLTIISSLFVILVQNPVYSVLFLILVFCNASSILILLEMDFIALLLLMIYVGAVAILFLFVVMMLNIHGLFFQHIPFIGLVFFIIILQFIFILYSNINCVVFQIPWNISSMQWNDLILNSYIIQSIGSLLFDYMWLYLILASIVLSIAMIGCIILTINQDKLLNLKGQKIADQGSDQMKTKISLITLKEINQN